MSAGFIVLHRELIEKPIWLNSTPEQRSILIALLIMANHKAHQWEWKGQKFTCERGQVITSLDSIAASSGKGVSVQNVRTALKRFENLEFLTGESTKQGRLITICNYCKYQDFKDAAHKAANSQLTDDQQTPNSQLTPNNNDNNENNETNITTPPQKARKSNTQPLDYSSWPSMPDDQIIKDWQALRKAKKAIITQTVVNRFGKELAQACAMGFTVNQCIETAVYKGWTGFEAEWMTNSTVVPINQQPKKSTYVPIPFPKSGS